VPRPAGRRNHAAPHRLRPAPLSGSPADETAIAVRSEVCAFRVHETVSWIWRLWVPGSCDGAEHQCDRQEAEPILATAGHHRCRLVGGCPSGVRFPAAAGTNRRAGVEAPADALGLSSAGSPGGSARFPHATTNTRHAARPVASRSTPAATSWLSRPRAALRAEPQTLGQSARGQRGLTESARAAAAGSCERGGRRIPPAPGRPAAG
jgi:hypothetical protein